jgi:UDPglucose--hexose-1-phosphate uridylyltransferase
MINQHCSSPESFIRQDPISKEWVIYSVSRKNRPHDRVVKSLNKPVVSYDKNCPFCPGNEKMVAVIKDEIKNPNGSGWLSRAVDNKFPALSQAAQTQRCKKGNYLCMGGYGQHEVIIENPDHSKDIPQYNVNELTSVIEIYHRRYLAMMNDNHIVMVTIFRNHGVNAGTSLVHPHSQIIGSPTVPRYIRIQEQISETYFDDNGICIYCDLINSELECDKRIICRNNSFVSFVPYAAKVPFEIWILPCRHTALFGNIRENEKEDLAMILKKILSKLCSLLNDPDYNYIIHTFTRYRADEPHIHWFLQIVPRLLTPAGFELGSGFHINPSIPEDDARKLKE